MTISTNFTLCLMGYGAPPRRSATLRERLTILKWITRVPMTLKKTKEISGSYLEKVKVSPETDPEIQEITREFQKKRI